MPLINDLPNKIEQNNAQDLDLGVQGHIAEPGLDLLFSSFVKIIECRTNL